MRRESSLRQVLRQSVLCFFFNLEEHTTTMGNLNNKKCLSTILISKAYSELTIPQLQSDLIVAGRIQFLERSRLVFNLWSKDICVFEGKSRWKREEEGKCQRRKARKFLRIFEGKFLSAFCSFLQKLSSLSQLIQEILAFLSAFPSSPPSSAPLSSVQPSSYHLEAHFRQSLWAYLWASPHSTLPFDFGGGEESSGCERRGGEWGWGDSSRGGRPMEKRSY